MLQQKPISGGTCEKCPAKPFPRTRPALYDAPVVVLAALIRRLALGLRQVDRASPSARPAAAGTGTGGAVAAADEGAPGGRFKVIIFLSHFSDHAFV